MKETFDPRKNYEKTRKLVGYQERAATLPRTYARLGFKCGLEVHQQLLTEKKLFCHCPAGRYHPHDDRDAEIVRHMRPTLSELGEYDGTALMEFKTRKNIIYRIKNETTCTYEIDDTPPFKINLQALDIAMEIALLLKTNIVGELHITRKQYLDGSIPTGFQRTGIVGIEGEIPLKNKKVRIIQLSIEEDSCREVSDIGHWRIYSTDRLGMPLIETVTYPDMKTPDEAAEAAQYIRFLCRSTGKVRTGIGAAREDVNVSISGGTRVEIKGVAHIIWIPELVHNEAFRQKALLEIAKNLNRRIADPKGWDIAFKELEFGYLESPYAPLKSAEENQHRFYAVNLPDFKGILSFFTQPGKIFAHDLSDRLKVIAGLERPNMLQSEDLDQTLAEEEWRFIRKILKAGENDAQILLWGPAEDMATALDTVRERCRLAMTGVPNETRKSFPDGTTIFERVLPGPDRMYPDTDSAPIPVEDEAIAAVRLRLPEEVRHRLQKMAEWSIPESAHRYILKRNLFPLLERIQADFDQDPRFVARILAQDMKHLEGKSSAPFSFSGDRIHQLFAFVHLQKLDREIVRAMLPVIYEHPNMEFSSVLITIQFSRFTPEAIYSHIPSLKEKFREINTSKKPDAIVHWIMGHLRKLALGNLSLSELREKIEKEAIS